LLKPGQYSLTLERAGFKKQERRTNVAVGQVATLNCTLEMGQASETIEVTAAASVANTETSGVATTYDQRIVQDVPNPGGDLTNIAQTAPGATMNTSGGYGNLTVNGMPATSNLFTVNGENDMDPFFNINNSGATNLTLGVNEIQEATVVTNTYSGQYGQQAGAQVTYITKSGTNDLHGSVKYDWNGRVMNANDWFANNSNTPRPFANANQWGADLGGPIFKNKTFFYVDYEGLRYVLPTVQNTFISTPFYRDGVLADIAATQPASLPLYQKLFGVWLGAPGAQNAVPSNEFDCPSIYSQDGNGNYTSKSPYFPTPAAGALSECVRSEWNEHRFTRSTSRWRLQHRERNPHRCSVQQQRLEHHIPAEIRARFLGSIQLHLGTRVR
jgi:hypothetical protein